MKRNCSMYWKNRKSREQSKRNLPKQNKKAQTRNSRERDETEFRKCISYFGFETTGKSKSTQVYSRAIQCLKYRMEWETEQGIDFDMIKDMLTEGPGLARYAKDKDNIRTTDASKTCLGIAIWLKQTDRVLKLMAFGSRLLNDSEKNGSVGELELLAIVWRLQKLRFYLYRKKSFFIPIIKNQKP